MATMSSIVNKLRNLDAYPKINEDFYSRTLSGGLITLVSSLAMLFLFFSEFSFYLHTVTQTKLLVDTSRGEKLRITVIIFDVTFSAIRCSLLSLDAMDISGEQHLDIRHDIFKKRIDAHGNVIEVKQDVIGAPKVSSKVSDDLGAFETSTWTHNYGVWQYTDFHKVKVGDHNGITTAMACGSIWLCIKNHQQKWLIDQEFLRHGACDVLYMVVVLGASGAYVWVGRVDAVQIEKPLQRHGGRLEHNETYCGSCFGAETSDDDCCNSCEEVQEAYRRKGWAMTNADLIDQVSFAAPIHKRFLGATTHIPYV
ncbi:hypothetical protein JRO89_XS02G0166300 [Xanthoceras sorbifolium]|uniref:Endoplasmic reticulum-Golgi intermediate compartment protein 3 n=1 Tax=Xanthoceras sorbifolium TaxID=99658 RepID=A0ABQ8IHH1_9ROSI|nr:hypothetical protein JRO89_XS02G0166300 [Xanthoceras sorbifolium]